MGRLVGVERENKAADELNPSNTYFTSSSYGRRWFALVITSLELRFLE
jgi:hypothetical protein